MSTYTFTLSIDVQADTPEEAEDLATDCVALVATDERTASSVLGVASWPAREKLAGVPA